MSVNCIRNSSRAALWTSFAQFGNLPARGPPCWGPIQYDVLSSHSWEHANACLASFTRCPWPRCRGWSQVVQMALPWGYITLPTSTPNPAPSLAIKWRLLKRQNYMNTNNAERKEEKPLRSYVAVTIKIRLDMPTAYYSLSRFERKWLQFFTQYCQSGQIWCTLPSCGPCSPFSTLLPAWLL